MAKLKFDYASPIEIWTVGAEMTPIFTINTETLELKGTYVEIQKRLDTGEERAITDNPISFTIKLTPEALGGMMMAVIPLAMQQQILRPATPALEVPPPPPDEPPPPPPEMEPPRVRLVPSLVTVGPSETVTFDTTVLNTEDTRVTWSTPDGGFVTDGVFYAPEFPGDYRVVVALVADSTRSAVSIVSVRPIS